MSAGKLEWEGQFLGTGPSSLGNGFWDMVGGGGPGNPRHFFLGLSSAVPEGRLALPWVAATDHPSLSCSSILGDSPTDRE